MTKIVGILGPKSRSVEVISSCLEAGMSGDNKYHQETLDNLKTSIKSTKKLCAVNAADPELAVVNTSEKPITLKADETVTIIPDKGEKSSFEVFPIYFDGLSKVDQVKGDDVVCVIKNSAMLTGSLFTLHAAQIHIDLPTLPDNDKETRELLGKLGDLSQTQIFAKIESEKACNSLLSMVIYVGLDAF
ncbi:putative pyruvate kinase, cytosolic isozyme-like isoform 2 [Capsicum annuum]|nr:putative pyruvate kinase, cytosolic isozyme-like isoform 2 [Capsicum annuum]